MFDVARRPADRVHRPGVDGLLFARAMIVASDLATVRAGIHDLGVRRVGCDVAAFAATHVIPVRAINRAFRAGTGDGHSGVVLLGAVDVIREPVVGNDMVKLRCGLVIHAGPGIAAVSGNSGAAVVAIRETLGIGGIDPQRVIISVRRADSAEGLASVIRSIHRSVQDVHRIF